MTAKFSLTKWVLLLTGALILSSCTSTTNISKVVDQDQFIFQDIDTLYLNMPENSPLEFLGFIDTGNLESGAGNAVVYQNVGGGAGVAAQLFAHAMVSNSAKNSRYTKAQELADQVLTPYEEPISEFTYDDLWAGIEEKQPISDVNLVAFRTADIDQPVTVIKITPSYTMSPDQCALMLINKVSAYKSNNPDSQIYYNEFVVISDPILEQDPELFWLDTNKTNVIETLGTEMFTDSLRLMSESLSTNFGINSKPKTVHYYFGESKKFERATVISHNCSRATVENLRGHIMSIPVDGDSFSTTDGCSL